MPSINEKELAASYGWSLAVLNSDKGLKSVFKKAVKETWSAARFVAAVRDTKWYKTRSESQRQSVILKKTDPKEWERRLMQMRHHIRTLYGEMSGGQELTDRWKGDAAIQAVSLGYSEDEIRHLIARGTNYTKLISEDRLGGQAGELEEQIRKWEQDYGFKVSDEWMGNRIKGSMMGHDSKESIQNAFQKYAKATYRSFSDQIDAGMTMRDIAEPYVQSYANLLEIPQGSIDLFRTDIRAALTDVNDKGEPRATPLYEFEKKLRKDPRWLKTKNAQDSLMSVGHSLLQQFGIAS